MFQENVPAAETRWCVAPGATDVAIIQEEKEPDCKCHYCLSTIWHLQVLRLSGMYSY